MLHRCCRGSASNANWTELKIKLALLVHIFRLLHCGRVAACTEFILFRFVLEKPLNYEFAISLFPFRLLRHLLSVTGVRSCQHRIHNLRIVQTTFPIIVLCRRAYTQKSNCIIWWSQTSKSDFRVSLSVEQQSHNADCNFCMHSHHHSIPWYSFFCVFLSFRFALSMPSCHRRRRWSLAVIVDMAIERRARTRRRWQPTMAVATLFHALFSARAHTQSS